MDRQPEQPPAGVTSARRRALIIEKTKLHIIFIEPLAAHLISRGWTVTVIAPAEAHHRLSSWITAFPGKLTFLEHRARNLHKALLIESFDYIFFSPLDFWNKIKHRKLLQLLPVLEKQLMLFAGFLLRARSTKIIPGIHTTEHFERMDSLSVWQISRSIDAYLWRRVLRRADAFTVVSRRMRDKCILANMSEKPILVPPVALHAPDKSRKSSGTERPLEIVLPGRIDPRLRDYDWIERIPEDWIGKVLISFVGVPVGNEGRRTIDRLRRRGFDQPKELGAKFIPEEDFDRLVSRAHLLFAPIPQKTALAGRLGEDRMFGVGFSAVRYGKPMLLPTWTPMDEEFEDNVVRYAGATDDFIEKINTFLSDPGSLDALAEKALTNARRFTPELIGFADELLALESPEKLDGHPPRKLREAQPMKASRAADGQ